MLDEERIEKECNLTDVEYIGYTDSDYLFKGKDVDGKMRMISLDRESGEIKIAKEYF